MNYLTKLKNKTIKIKAYSIFYHLKYVRYRKILDLLTIDEVKT